MKYHIPVMMVITVALSLMKCGSTSTENTEAADSLKTDTLLSQQENGPATEEASSSSDVPVTSSKAVARGDLQLDTLLAFKNEDELVDAFGRENIVREKDLVYLFKGTNKEVVLDVLEGSFGMIKATSPTQWSMKNGLRLGMSYSEIAELDGPMAFELSSGRSGLVGKLSQQGVIFSFAIPDDLKTSLKPKGEWIGFTDTSPEERARIIVSEILLYYPDEFGGYGD